MATMLTKRSPKNNARLTAVIVQGPKELQDFDVGVK